MTDDGYEGVREGNVSVRTVNLDSSGGFLTARVLIERQRREWHPAHGATPDDLPADIAETLLDWLTGPDGATAAEWREWALELDGSPYPDEQLMARLASRLHDWDELRTWLDSKGELFTSGGLAVELDTLPLVKSGTHAGKFIVTREWIMENVITREEPEPEPLTVGSWAVIRDSWPEHAGTIGTIQLAGMQPLNGEPRYTLELEDGDWIALESLKDVEPADKPETLLEPEVDR